MINKYLISNFNSSLKGKHCLSKKHYCLKKHSTRRKIREFELSRTEFIEPTLGLVSFPFSRDPKRNHSPS